MLNENIGVIRAIWRFFQFRWLRQALGIIRAGDEQFTGSVGGIRDAFDIHQDRLVNQFQGLRDAVSEVETELEGRRQRLLSLNEEEKDLLVHRDGALVKIEEAKAGNDTAALERHSQAFERYQTRIDEIEAEQARLKKEVEESSGVMKKYMMQLTALQAEIRKVPQEKASAIADFVSAKKIIELNDRLQGIQTSIDRGPLDAVLKHNAELTAKARISEKLAGTDVRLQDQEYAQAGKTTSARNTMEQMLAARATERAARAGTTPVTEKPAVAERPTI